MRALGKGTAIALRPQECLTFFQAIEDRDKALHEANKRFSLLKDDFKYNLTLLEARDTELRRLEGVATTLYGDVETLKAEKAALTQRLDRAHVKENERKERMKSEAALHKVQISLVNTTRDVLIVDFVTHHDFVANARRCTG